MTNISPKVMNFTYLIPSGLSKISKIETTSKVSLKFTIRINLGRRGAHASNTQLWTQPANPPHSPERAITRPKRTHSPHRNH